MVSDPFGAEVECVLYFRVLPYLRPTFINIRQPGKGEDPGPHWPIVPQRQTQTYRGTDKYLDR
jgi:hypothetical protein